MCKRLRMGLTQVSAPFGPSCLRMPLQGAEASRGGQGRIDTPAYAQWIVKVFVAGAETAKRPVQ